MIGEFGRVERAYGISRSGNLAGGLIPKIGHHRDTTAVTAEGIMHTVVQTHMRYRVERERDIAGPGMGHADATQLREAIKHEPVQDRRTGFRCYGREPGPSAEDDTPAIGRDTIIAKDTACVGERASSWDQRCCEIRR